MTTLETTTLETTTLETTTLETTTLETTTLETTTLEVRKYLSLFNLQLILFANNVYIVLIQGNVLKEIVN